MLREKRQPFTIAIGERYSPKIHMLQIGSSCVIYREFKKDFISYFKDPDIVLDLTFLKSADVNFVVCFLTLKELIH